MLSIRLLLIAILSLCYLAFGLVILLYFLIDSPCLVIFLGFLLILLMSLILSILPNLILHCSLPKSVRLTIMIFVFGLVLCFGMTLGLLAVLVPFLLILHLIL